MTAIPTTSGRPIAEPVRRCIALLPDRRSTDQPRPSGAVTGDTFTQLDQAIQRLTCAIEALAAKP